MQTLRFDILGQAHLTFGDFDRQVVRHDLVGLLKELVVILARVFNEVSSARLAVWPPYWLDATSFMIWVICVAAMEMLFGEPIGALPE